MDQPSNGTLLVTYFDMYDLFVCDLMSVKEIAAHYCVSIGKVKRVLGKMNISAKERKGVDQ